MMWWSYGYDGWNWFWMGGLMLLFWGGVILLVISLIRSYSRAPREGDQAIETLRRRFAAGEIDEEQFLKARKALQA